MALVLKDRVRETSTTTGTGTFTLAGAVAGFQSFSAIGTGNSTYYTIVSTSDWEVGIGTWTTPNQLSRDTVLASTNAGALVTFGSGTKDVFLTFPAEGFAVPPAIGGATPNTITGTTVTVNTQIDFPAIINTGSTDGIMEMIDGGDGNDYLDIYTYDGTNKIPVQFSGGATLRSAGVNTGRIAFANPTNTSYAVLTFPNSLSTNLTLTLPSSVGSANQVLKTDGTGITSWVTPNAGTVTSVGGTGTVNGLTLTGTVTGSGNLTLGGTLSLVSPPAIGSTTPNTGAFTTLSASSTVSGTGFSTYLASPPAIGGTTPNSGAFTTLTTTGAVTTTAVSDPSAPSNGNLSVYAKSFSGYTTLAARNALNTSFGLQTALWSKSVQMWTPTNAINGSFLGNLATGSGTHAVVTPTAGSTLYQTIRRSTYANVITITNQLLGVTASYGACFRGSVAGQGGFFFYTRCGFDTWTNGGRFFAGAATSTAVVNSADPSALNNTVGFCVDAADNGAISFLTRGTAATKASTGYTITSNKGYDLYIYCSPNSSQYTWMIVDINAGTSATGTATANLPTNTTIAPPYVCASNAALTAATAINLGVNKIYVESDY